MKRLLVLAVCGLLYAGTVQAQTFYNMGGGLSVDSDGNSYQRIGNTTISSNGTSYQHIGNSTYGSDGSSSMRIGDTYYHRDSQGNSSTSRCSSMGFMTTCD